MATPSEALGTARDFARLVRLSHTVFGLPFALASAALGHRIATASGAEGLTMGRLAWVLVAFTAVRAAAMGFNRIVDRDIDAANPRTAGRELPAGVISLGAARGFTLAAAGLFVGAAWALGPLPLLLSPLCLAVVLGYSYVKRFSWSSHLFLGLALALAPGGAWIAVTGTFDGWTTPAVLMVAVATWVAGFDVLYSLQDREFDRTRGLHSIPARFGIRGALIASGALHVATVGCLIGVHALSALGGWHAVGIGLIAVLLVYEHAIVGPDDLSRIDRAFFDLNGYVSVAYLLCLSLDLWL